MGSNIRYSRGPWRPFGGLGVGQSHEAFVWRRCLALVLGGDGEVLAIDVAEAPVSDLNESVSEGNSLLTSRNELRGLL